MINRKLLLRQMLMLSGLALILLALTLMIPVLILAQDSSGIGTDWISGSPMIDSKMAQDSADKFLNNAAITGTLPLNSIAAQACSPETLAYWKLDETGGPPYDDFYNGHDALCGAGHPCPTSLKGRVNGGQKFDGANTGIDVPISDDSFNWGPNDSFSIELWMKGIPGKTCAVAGIPNNEVVIGRDDRPATQLHWWLGCWSGTGKARFQLHDTSGSSEFLDGPVINDGAWHHLVAVRDGVGNVNRLYVDGIQADAKTKVYTAGFESATVPLNIGWLDQRFNFEGILDEVAVYSRTLSLNEIQAHYNNGVPGPGYCGGPFAPTIISNPVVSADSGQTYTYTVIAVGNPAPTYTLITQPSGMGVNTTSGVISWIPALGQQGFHNVQVQATNSAGADVQIFTVGVDVSTIYLPLLLK